MTDFPGRLMSLLEDEDVQRCMHWLPSGRAFEISNPELFISTVLRIHFNSVQFESFVVRLGSKYIWSRQKAPRIMYRHRLQDNSSPLLICNFAEWGFRRLGEKVNKRYLSYTFGSPLFRRDKPHLCNSMTLVKKIKPSRDKKLLIHMFDATKEPTAVPSVGLKKAPVFNHTAMSSWEYHSCLSSAHPREQYASFSLQQSLRNSTCQMLPLQSLHGCITFNANSHRERVSKSKQENDQNAAAAAVALINLANNEWSETKPVYDCTNKGPPNTTSHTL
ncbi:hypothetical protein HJC23_004064 [Cyclotella cryptica]|uniref:HSF-type DNA-binding domain-containing protein n=1 Tax=Cyclotella cryptica TaxID=29204 RepID=A0ABD3PIZ4_9STRA